MLSSGFTGLDNLFNILEDKKFRNGGAGGSGGNF
jgi:hypothetical protein